MHDQELPTTSTPGPPGVNSSNPFHEFTMDVANMLKAFIGLNFMYVAYAFSKAGIIRGSIGLLLITFITEHCCILLVQVKNAMPIALGGNHEHPNSISTSVTPSSSLPRDESASTSTPSSTVVPTYADIANYVGGKPAENLINFALVLTQFGYCGGYLIFVSQTVHDIVGSEHPVWMFILFPLPILSVLAILRSIRSLGPVSVLANIALFIGFIAVVVFIIKHFHWQPSSPPLTSLPLFFGQMTAALEGIGLVVPVETSMPNRRRFPLVLRIALIVLTCVLLVVGVLGFGVFGEDTKSIILLNFGQTSVVIVVKIVLIIGILLTYPLQIIPVFEFVEKVLIPSPMVDSTELETIHGSDIDQQSLQTEGSERDGSIGTDENDEFIFLRDRRKIFARLVVVILTAFTAALGGASFGLFQSLVGSLGASCLAYTAPALFHTMMFKDSLSRSVKAKNMAIVSFGILGSILGTAVTLKEIAEIHRGNATPV